MFITVHCSLGSWGSSLGWERHAWWTEFGVELPNTLRTVTSAPSVGLVFTEILNIVDLLGHPTVVIVTGVWTCLDMYMSGHGWTWLDMAGHGPWG